MNTLNKIISKLSMNLLFIFILGVPSGAIATGFGGLEFFSGDAVGIGGTIGKVDVETFGWYAGFQASGLGIKDSGVSYPVAKTVFNDEERGTFDTTAGISGGTTYALNDQFYFLAGIGLHSQSDMVEFNDPLQILGNRGQYYVKKDSRSVVIVELRVGFRFNPEYSWAVLVGHQTERVGTMFGVYWNIN